MNFVLLTCFLRWNAIYGRGENSAAMRGDAAEVVKQVSLSLIEFFNFSYQVLSTLKFIIITDRVQDCISVSFKLE